MNLSKQKPRRHRLSLRAAPVILGLLVVSFAGLSSSGATISGVSLPPWQHPTPAPSSCPSGSTLEVATNHSSGPQCVITSTGTPVGGIKHVWLIIEENKSYDSTFTGLNQNSYLWQTLPQQGALLTKYYGTGHFSMDNYI